MEIQWDGAIIPLSFSLSLCLSVSLSLCLSVTPSLRHSVSPSESGRQQPLDLPHDALDLFLVGERDHKEFVPLADADHPVGE